MTITISGTTGIAGVDGSASTPAVQGADPNTGIFYPAADTIAFAEGGTEVMRINSSGNVGIGTSSLPSGSRLAVVGGGVQLSGGTTSQEGIRIQRASGYASITGVNNDNNAFNPIAFFTSGTEAARIDSSGNLLVNTTTAQTGAKLAVTGGIQGTITSATAVTCAGQTSIDFTGIPSWVKRITVMFSGVSTSGTSLFLVQLGDAGGFEITGYTSQANSITTTPAVTATTNTAGFVLGASALVAANTYSGTISIVKLDGNSWVYSSLIIRDGTASSGFGAGSKTLSDTLTQVRITTVNGTDTFDTTPSAGTINILYEG